MSALFFSLLAWRRLDRWGFALGMTIRRRVMARDPEPSLYCNQGGTVHPLDPFTHRCPCGNCWSEISAMRG
jgi:hypothetical protein